MRQVKAIDLIKFKNVIDALFDDSQLILPSFVEVHSETYCLKGSGVGQQATNYIMESLKVYYEESNMNFEYVFKRILHCFFRTENVLREFFCARLAKESGPKLGIIEYHSSILYILYTGMHFRMERELEFFKVFADAHIKFLTLDIIELIKFYYTKETQRLMIEKILDFINIVLLSRPRVLGMTTFENRELARKRVKDNIMIYYELFETYVF